MKTPNIHMQQDVIRMRNRTRIIDLLQWTNGGMNIFIYNSALEYLNEFFGKEDDAVGLLTKQKEFWTWWQGLWNGRDASFIDEWDGLEDSIIVEDLRTIYRDIHNAKMLASEIHPPRQVYPPGFTHIKIEMA